MHRHERSVAGGRGSIGDEVDAAIGLPTPSTAADATAAPLPSVSVVIPARDADATIAATLDSVLSQDYPGSVEVIVADGSEMPATSEVVRRLYPTVRLIPNPARSIGAGFNAALRASTGEIIARCDTRAMLPSGYLRRAVETLKKTSAANVGGRQQPAGSTLFERAVAIAMTIPLGAGDVRYRLGGPEGSVDTVYLGVFRRETLKVAGGLDPTLLRNEDYELNWRLRESGATVWFDPELVAIYQPRGTLREIAKQYFDYGRWKRVVLLRHPTSLQIRQIFAPLLVLGLAASGVLALAGAHQAVPAALPLTYLFVLGAGSLVVGIRHGTPAGLLLPLILVAMHLSWGSGFFFPVRKVS